MRIRQATLDDAARIVSLFIAQVGIWQRLNEQGEVEDLPYEALTIYERWLHGGAWMSLETGAIWLSHLLSGGGLAYIAEADGALLAYAEAFVNRELTPMNTHLHIDEMRFDPAAPDEVHHLLAEAIQRDGRGLGRISVAYADYDQAAATYYRMHFGAQEVFRLKRYALPAQIGQSFYKSQEFDRADASLIDGWAMATGRWTSPRAMWEREWAEHWRGIPEIIARGKHRHYINASGHEAVVCFHQQLYNERNAAVYCWSPRNLSAQLLAAIRDKGHRLGFRLLILALPQESASLLPADATAEPNEQIIAIAKV